MNIAPFSTIKIITDITHMRFSFTVSLDASKFLPATQCVCASCIHTDGNRLPKLDLTRPRADSGFVCDQWVSSDALERTYLWADRGMLLRDCSFDLICYQKPFHHFLGSIPDSSQHYVQLPWLPCWLSNAWAPDPWSLHIRSQRWILE